MMWRCIMQVVFAGLAAFYLQGGVIDAEAMVQGVRGGIDEIVTTRRLIHIVRTYSIFKDKKKAVTLGCNRFDPATIGAFIDLFEKINAPTNEESSADSDSEINPF